MYSDVTHRNETKPCDAGYWYDPASGYESTIVTEVRYLRIQELYYSLLLYIKDAISAKCDIHVHE